MRQRERDAWDCFAKVYCPTIYAHCRKAGVEASAAADVCQNVLFKVAKNIDRFRKDSPTDSFRGWLYRITTNEIFDYFRRRRKEFTARGGSGFAKFLEEIPDTPSSDPALSSESCLNRAVNSDSEQSPGKNDPTKNSPYEGFSADISILTTPNIGNELRFALANLQPTFEPRTWRAFEATAVEKRSCKEVGVELGMTEHAVRQAKYRVTRKFREIYGELINLG
jgi:RNA polymerase sigma-70 factor (ECF subfamily)